jgi:DDE superfamily endonuclease
MARKLVWIENQNFQDFECSECQWVFKPTVRWQSAFLNFLGRLLCLMRKSRRKVFLIVDGHPAHRSRSVGRWLAVHREQIEVFQLPSYSPELNPDEFLNGPSRERAGSDGRR